jgi:ubiquinone/menaquinone biosynthesis C-methylase UbiE
MKTKQLTYIPNFADETLKRAINVEYTEVACNSDHKIHFTSGLPLTKRLGYSEDVIAQIPSEAVRPFAGVGNPHDIRSIDPDESILDIGSGGGLDLLVAWINGSKMTELTGIDITDAMIQKAGENAEYIGAKNIRFISGYAENIPLKDNSIDVVISNGVINLCTDKLQVFREIFRVLKPGGRFQIADVLLRHPVPNESRDMVHLWTNCIAGGVPMDEYKEIIHTAGFDNVEIVKSYEVFKDARIAKSAEKFGARGFNILGYKS